MSAVAWRERLRKVNLESDVAMRVYQLERTMQSIDREDTVLSRSKSFREQMGQITTQNTIHVLYHIHPDDITSMIEGDYEALRQSKHLPVQLDSELSKNPIKNDEKDKKADRRPVIYQHYHVNDNGRSPTVLEYVQIVKVAMAYLRYCEKVAAGQNPSPADKKVAEEVDKTVPAPSKDDKTRPGYTGTHPRYGNSDSFRKGLAEWIASMRSILRSIDPRDHTKPLRFAISETGWTITPSNRRFAHAEHGDHGNKIMNLVDAITRMALPGSTYTMRYIIVLEIVDPSLASPAERVLSRLSSSYTTCGGTNQELGGLSTASGDKSLPIAAYREVSNRLADFIQENIERDSAYLDEELELHELARNTKARLKQLDQARKVNAEGQQRIIELEDEIQKKAKDLDTLLPEWQEARRDEIDAHKQCEGLSTLARELKDILTND